MLRAWLAAHRSAAATAVSGAVVTALIATVAIVSGGYDAQRFDLGDGSVWVANGSKQVIGRANTQVLALDTVVGTDGTELSLVQSDAGLFVFDLTDNKVDVVDPATATVTASAPLPPRTTDVQIAGNNLVIHSAPSGGVWITPIIDLATFDSAAEPSFSLGTDSLVSVTPAGRLFLFSPTAGEIYEVDATADDAVIDTTAVTLGEPGGSIALTAVGDRPVLLDVDSKSLLLGGRTVELAEALGEGTAALQMPSAGSGDVLIASQGVMLSVSFATGATRVLTQQGDGNPVRPTVVGECTFAGWSGGTVWRQCGNASPVELELKSVPVAAARLEFASSGTEVVLSDPRAGGVWAVSTTGQLINNWQDLVEEVQDREVVADSDEDTDPEPEKNQLPPIAVDDDFGARPGRASVLPVLLNDYDPNGDVLVIDTVEAISPIVGTIDVINDGQRLQLTLAPSATGRIAFAYTVSDGRGGTASAIVSVAVRAAEENSAPQQVRTTRALVAEGSRVSTSVLGDWVDPDGDAFYLSSASTSEPDSVSFKPGGIVVFQDGGGSGEVRSVPLVVSDGAALGAGSLTVTVRARDTVPIRTDAFVVLAYAGQETTIAPLDHVRGGTDVIRLASVPEKPGSTIQASLEAGTFRFTSDQVRTHYLEYVVNDGEQTATGTVRVDVAMPPDANATPITIPKTAFVRTLSSETIDVASADLDPAGGVLLVTETYNIPSDEPLTADVIDQKAVRITLTGPLSGPVSLNYRVTNGLAEAEGSITVVEIPQPTIYQPPIAADDSVTVRVGDAIDIPVLNNDVQPDGADLTLDAELVSDTGADSGLLFASGRVLRYLAPDRPGNFSAVYRITGPGQQEAQARVAISVREAVAATNAAPVPDAITARVRAGEKVRIPVRLTGIDPDGDSVRILGQETNPEKGSVVAVGADYLEYAAGTYSAGTDTFSYSVIDTLGARATAQVRIGISARSTGSRNPIAVVDDVTTRPGNIVSVRVLNNDSDPDGSTLSVLGVEPNSEGVTATVSNDVVIVTTPTEEGTYGVTYTIGNERGGTSSNFIRVKVDPNAPPAYPIARDTVLTLSDILDREQIEVDVLANVFFVDGAVTDLDLSVLSGYSSTAAVTSRKRIAVTITDESQIIPFAVANPDELSAAAFAFVWVPGLADTLPQLDRTARPISVLSETSVRIPINDYVIAVGGRQVRLADLTSVRATHADGGSLVVDDRTLTYRSADGYFGPASISFEVTDGRTASDPEGRRSTLVLPISVEPRQNQPPVFTGGIIDFEPGERKSIDLAKLTNYPDGDVDDLAFRQIAVPPDGFSYTITRSILTIEANADTRRGTSTALTIGVRARAVEGQAGRIQLNVVASTRPLAQPAADEVVAPRNATTTIDVLENDEATNPFPGRPLRVLDVRGIDGASLPAGVTVTPNGDRSRLSVTVAATAAPVDVNLQYQVADATGESERYTYGSVRISVQDRPDTPVAPARADGGYEEGLLTLRLTAPQANNSPITGYTVVSSTGEYRRDCGLELRCVLTDLQPGSRYQFSVIATNAIGASDASGLSVPLSADYLPAAPVSVIATATAANPSGGALRVSWSRVADPNPGSAVLGYTVRITGPSTDFTATVGPATTSLDTTAGGALKANVQYTATVYARNSAAVISDADWRRASSAPTTTIGPPSQTSGGVQAVVVGTEGNIEVTWGASDPNGGTTVRYAVGRFSGGQAAPTECAVGGSRAGVADGAAAPVASPWVDRNTTDQTNYRYVVYSENELFCTVTTSGAVESKAAPGAVVSTTKRAPHGGQFDLQVGSLAVQSGVVSHYQAQINGSGVWFDVTAGSWLTSITIDQGVYGRDITVAYRACRDSGTGLCGPTTTESPLRPINARGSIVSCVSGEVPVSNPPLNANSPEAQYLYSYNDGGAAGIWSDYALDAAAPEPSPVGSGVVTVRMKARITFGDSEPVVDPGYAQATCQSSEPTP